MSLIFLIYSKEFLKAPTNTENNLTINNTEESKNIDTEDKQASKETTINNISSKDKPTQNKPQKSDSNNKKTIICDYCKKEVDRWFFVGELKLCPPCEYEYNNRFAKCYECGYTYRHDEMIADTCYHCYNKRWPENSTNDSDDLPTTSPPSSEVIPDQIPSIENEISEDTSI